MDPSRLPRLPLAEGRRSGSASVPSHPTSGALSTSVVVESIDRSQNMPSRRRERRRESSSSASTSDDSCCCPSCCSRSCNAQICCSYFIALLSTCLVVGGVYLSIVEWNRLWLAFSLFGLLLVFFGACMYCCGTKALSRKYSRNDECDDFDDRFEDEITVEDRHRRPSRNKRKRRNRPEDLGESAADRGMHAARSLSQLSLNMIPQYFAPSDTGSSAPGQLLASSRTNTLMTTASAGAHCQTASVSFSQIFSLNGQSFLILPIANDSLEATRQRNSQSSEQSIPLNSLVVKVTTPEDERSLADGPFSSRKPTVTEFLAKLDPKSYCLLKSGQTPSSLNQQGDDVEIQTEEDSSLISVPSSSYNFASSRPSVSCDDSGITTTSQGSQPENPSKDSSSAFVPMNAATSCATSSTASVDVSSPTSSSSCLVASSHARNQNDAKHNPKPAARTSRSGPVTGASVVTIDHSQSSVPDQGISSRTKPEAGGQGNETISSSFFISFPSTGSGKRTEKGNPRTPACLQPTASAASSSFVDNQKARHQRKDPSIVHPSQDHGTDAIIPAAGTSFASPALVRRDTFSKKGRRSTKTLLPAHESESSSEISSPNEQSLGVNLIDLMDRRRDSRAEAEAERSHALFSSSGNHYEELAYDSSDLEDSEFLSPPPSYSEVIDSAIHFESPPEASGVSSGTL